MVRRLRVPFLVFILGLLCRVQGVEAQIFETRVTFGQSYPTGQILWPRPQAYSAVGYKGFPSYEHYRDYMNLRYPKFYGGFHSSYFDNMGISPGDIGPRGNGIYPTPW